MTIHSVKLYHAQGPDHVVVVSTEPSYKDPNTALIRVARGKSVKQLGQGTAYGPFAEPELSARFEQILSQLKDEGFTEALIASDLAELKSKDSKKRARAAGRLGRKCNKEAVPPLLATLEDAVDDSCTIIDALGEIGDPRAIEAVRGYASRKLLSRRRSGVEALRKLGDQQGLAQAVQRIRDDLPQGLVTALDAEEEKGALDAAMQLSIKKAGRALDALYELDHPMGNKVVREALGKFTLGQPFVWRYAKSIFKRAMLRRDHVTLGFLAHKIESEGKSSHGDVAMLKSGYDGKKRNTTIFHRKTQRYLRRAAWRHLSTLAFWRPEEYALAAAEAIAHYSQDDELIPGGSYGRYADCYLLHRVMWGRSKRFKLNSRNLKFKFRGSSTVKPAHGVREESFAELWDRRPSAYLILLGRAQLRVVHEFAVGAVQERHPDIIQQAGPDLLVGMLGAPYEGTVELGVAELERRFDPAHPDWTLVHLLLGDERDSVRELGHRLLKLSAPQWCHEIERILDFVTAPHASTRMLAAEIAAAACKSLHPEARSRLAARILAELQKEEPEPTAHAGLARLAREGVAEEVGKLVSTQDLLAIIEKGSESAKALAGHLLILRPSAVEEIGLTGVVSLAGNSMYAVRQAAAQLLRGAVDRLRKDPSILFALVESTWPDTRHVAFQILRDEIDVAALGLDGLLGLCDSNLPDVQAVGEELVRKHLDTLEPATLVYRLAEHPHPFMHHFALDLVHDHLREGFVPLAKVEPLFRAILLNVWPSAKDKRRVIDFLVARGTHDELQAGVATRVLGDFVHTQTLRDFEQALAGLAQIKLAFPKIESVVRVPGGET
ncbi:HEAT repeat domain-containing protein [Myxococcota bacterium]